MNRIINATYGAVTGLAIMAAAVAATAQVQPKGGTFPTQGQPAQVQSQGQANQGQMQAQIAQEMERAKARQAFQRGLTMAKNAEQRLVNLGETPENLEFLRSSIR